MKNLFEIPKFELLEIPIDESGVDIFTSLDPETELIDDEPGTENGENGIPGSQVPEVE